MAARALVLFAHGARDPKWAGPFERLKLVLQGRLPDTFVGLAFLEFMMPDLPGLVLQAVQQGAVSVRIVPVFLGQGGHVLRDLPVLVDMLRRAHPAVAFEVVEAVGEDADVLEAIATYSAKGF